MPAGTGPPVRSLGLAIAITGSLELDVVLELDLDEVQRPLHRGRVQLAEAVAVRMVEEHQQEQQAA